MRYPRVYTTTMKTAPEVALTTAGALTRPAEAERTDIPSMASGRAFRKEPVHGLSPVPSRQCQEARPRSEG